MATRVFLHGAILCLFWGAMGWPSITSAQQSNARRRTAPLEIERRLLEMRAQSVSQAIEEKRLQIDELQAMLDKVRATQPKYSLTSDQVRDELISGVLKTLLSVEMEKRVNESMLELVAKDMEESQTSAARKARFSAERKQIMLSIELEKQRMSRAESDRERAEAQIALMKSEIRLEQLEIERKVDEEQSKEQLMQELAQLKRESVATRVREDLAKAQLKELSESITQARRSQEIQRQLDASYRRLDALREQRDELELDAELSKMRLKLQLDLEKERAEQAEKEEGNEQ